MRSFAVRHMALNKALSKTKRKGYALDRAAIMSHTSETESSDEEEFPPAKRVFADSPQVFRACKLGFPGKWRTASQLWDFIVSLDGEDYLAEMGLTVYDASYYWVQVSTLEDEGETLYHSEVDRHGNPMGTQRMVMWLCNLPDVPGLGYWARPGSTTAPTPTESAAAPPQAPSPVANSLLVVGARFNHPNPLGQHPIQQTVEQEQPQQGHESCTQATATPPPQVVHTQSKLVELGTATCPIYSPSEQDILSRTSCIAPIDQEVFKDAHKDAVERLQQEGIMPRSAAREKEWRANNAARHVSLETVSRTVVEGDVIDHNQSLQFDARSQSQASAQDQTEKVAANMEQRAKEVEGFFGRDPGKKRQDKKRSRSITRADTVASQPPAKRMRRTLTAARNRVSRVITPSTFAEEHRLDRLAEATKRMSLSTPLHIIQVTGFAPGVAKERVKIAFIGNTGVGKTAFIQSFRTNNFGAQQASTTAIKYADGYEVDTINVVLDGIPVSCETWDVSSQCDENNFKNANTVRPLLMTFYDAVVICHDISDDTTLKAVETKWAYDAEHYCTGSPTILLGLKVDLRKPLPSLRLSHLMEPTQTSFGQGEHVVKRMGMQAHYEASAKTGEGVSDFFESTIRFALDRRPRHEVVPGPVVSRAKKAWKSIKKHMRS